MAVKKTGNPGQNGVEGFAVIETDGVSSGLIVNVTVFDCTKAGVAQVTFEVISTCSISPFANDEEVYEEEFVPTLTPFSFH
ncbi:MAG TPA: hypothetical protein VEB42_02600 [Chitinophagaceae bacterium]|nr:hypothetical protein [Chitinophagaceae bacterium]